MSEKLIDQLVPDLKHGHLEALLATTFEMNGGFIDDDFLPTVLGQGSTAQHRVSGRVALQRALASVLSPTVLMDARRYRGGRPSLRLELVPRLGVGSSLLHAKVCVLVQQGAVRLVVGSANLTETAYRKNREVAAVLTVTEKDTKSGALVAAALEAMPEMLSRWWTAGADTAWRTAQARLRELGVAGGRPDDNADDAFVWSDGAHRLWERVVQAWPEGESVERVHIVSPFWSEDGGDGPVARLLTTLRERGAMTEKARTQLTLCASAGPFLDPPLPSLPKSYAQLRIPGVVIDGAAVLPVVEAAEAGADDVRATRALHAKLVCIEGPKTTLVYLGSANFTGPGFGFYSAANIEAGLLLRRRGKAAQELVSLLPPLAEHRVALDGSGDAVYADVRLDDDDGVIWPAFIEQICLVPAANDPTRLALQIVCLAEGNDVVIDVRERIVFANAHVDAGTITVDIDGDMLRQVLIDREVRVRFRGGSPDGALVPLNVDAVARYSLPLAPNAGPLSEEALLAYYQGKLSFEDLFADVVDEEEDDGAARHDVASTSEVDPCHIQSYQVRAFIEALPGIEHDVVAAATPAALRFALHGPVSPLALARSIKHRADAGTRSPTAAGFQLVELLALLERACANRDGDAAEAIDDVVDDLCVVLDDVCALAPGGMPKSFERYQRAIRPARAKAKGR